MSVHDLTRSQLVQLKQEMLADDMEGDVSWYELAIADDLVTDEQVFGAYEGTSFTEEDFS